MAAPRGILSLDLIDLQPKAIANAVAQIIRVASGGLEPFPDGYEVMPGAEITLSADRTVAVLKQFLIETDRHRYQVRVKPKKPPARK